jgi:hypothetical protein
VEAHAFDFAVKDQLECRVLDARAGAVDLIEEEDASLGASRVQPVRRSKGRNASFLDAVVIGDTDQVAFGEERQADIEEALARVLGDRCRDCRLADTVGSAEQDRVVDVLEDEVKGLEVDGIRCSHVGVFLVGLVEVRRFPSL